ncbi:MAG: polysaccharide deacetylase family protein [Ignavibacteriaceae bacterium]|nr:polysaccharide deacetylase family protein [Ignavibacteriaceae bacterium]
MNLNFKYNPPLIIKKLFGDFYWTTSNNKILLTFDDGPTVEATDLILKTLDEFKIKALFFCVGQNVEKNPELANEIIKQGHTLGNHNYRHRQLIKLSKQEQINEIKKCNDVLLNKTGIKPIFYRPPYGKFNLSTNKFLKKFELRNVMWSLLTYDFKNDFNLVKYSVDKHLKSNSIVVLHDSIKSKNIIVDSINYVAEQAAKKGLSFGETAECLK